MSMRAEPDHSVHDLIVERWSPYAFADRSVSREDLVSLFEAARWAPSSYNEQPWRYIVATRDEPDTYGKILSCLVDANQIWAKRAPVLALGITHLAFSYNGKPNKAAHHDLGLAAGNLVAEATSRGLCVHQMIGIRPGEARELFAIPEDHEPLTGLAIGYPDAPDTLPEGYRERDLERRPRRPLEEFVFGRNWGETAEAIRKR